MTSHRLHSKRTRAFNAKAKRLSNYHKNTTLCFVTGRDFSYSTTDFLFFNPYNIPLPSKTLSLLMLGPKFIPFPRDASNDEIKLAFKQYARRLRIRFMHAFGNNKNDDFNPRFYIPKPGFQPEPGPPSLESYLRNIEETINARLTRDPMIYTRQLHPLAKYAKYLKANPDIIITDTDKNLGPIVLPTNEYRRLCMEHLNDASTYHRVSFLKLFELHHEATRSFHYILRDPIYRDELTNHDDVHAWLLHQLDLEHQVPRFRVIPKPHKAGRLKSRPISGAINWVTTAPAIAATHLLTPALTAAYNDNVIKNSQQIIRELEGRIIPLDSTLFSFDVVSLYTNMQLPSIHEILHTARENPNNLLSPLGIALALKCLDFSALQFEETYYTQISGMPMGTNVAVVLANLYLYYGIDKSMLIQSLLNTGIFETWKRYIDDSFGILIHANNDGRNFEDFCNTLNTLLPGIRWTFETSDTCIAFLDLFIHKDQISETHCRLRFTTHQKILNKYLYLPSPSSHAPALQRGFVIGELIRYVRNSTRETDFKILRSKFRLRLLKRGYTNTWIDKVFHHVRYTLRDNFLLEKGPDNTIALPFIIRYNSRITRMNLPRLIHNYFDIDVASVFPNDAHLRPILSFQSNTPLRTFLYRNMTPSPLTMSDGPPPDKRIRSESPPHDNYDEPYFNYPDHPPSPKRPRYQVDFDDEPWEDTLYWWDFEYEHNRRNY
jgi:hypothetical protein